MRSTLYWFVSTTIAVLSMRAAAQTDAEAELLALADPAFQALSVSGSSKAALLGIGIMAVAYTYRRAWLNRSQPQGN